MMLMLSWVTSGDIGTFFAGMLRIGMMNIIAWVYNLISTFYNIFFYITKVTILSGSDDSLIMGIYERIQVILAVVMVFYVTLEFVKYIVNPDTFGDKEKGGGGLLKRILIVIVLMAFTPKIFGLAYDVQSRIINSDIIPKVMINNYTEAKHNGLMGNGGKFSRDLLSLFYKPFEGDNGQLPTGKCDDKRSAQQVVSDNLDALEEHGKMVNATYCIANAGGTVIEDGQTHEHPYLISMGFGGLLPLVIGCFMIWVLVNYCAEAGRVIIQFVFLQIIAPIPILSYIAPGKDGMFNKWLKQCVTTYIDLFIRLFIMYLVMMISQLLLQSGVSGVKFFDGFDKLAWDIKLWIILFLFVGLCLFAMKAPKMVKELLPGGSNAASGDFGIGGKAFKERFTPAGRVAGAVGGSLATGVAGSAHRIYQGNRGLRKKWKEANNIKDNTERRKKKAGLVAGSVGRTIKGGAVGAVTGLGRGLVNGGKKGNIIKNVGTGLKNQMAANERYGNIVENDYKTMHRVTDRARDFLKLKSRIEVREKEKTRIEERSKQLTSIKTLNDDMRARAEKKLNENGNAAILGAEKKLRDMKEDPATMAQYTVSKYATQDEADTAYELAVQLEKDKVNKANYMSINETTGKLEFNEKGYNDALSRAGEGVDKSQYVATKYKTLAEANAARDAELEKLQKELKDIKDREINKYIDNAVNTGSDQMILDLKAKQIANVDAYNKNTSLSEFKIDIDAYKDLSADNLDKHVKTVVSSQLTKDSIRISELTGEQQKIKNEIEGSNISGGGTKK